MNSINHIDLSKLKRCDQNWDDMPENEKGRLCEKCSETIIDFRKKSKNEISQAHFFSDKKVCGVYTKNQLFEKSTSLKSKGFSHYYSSMYLAILGLVSTPMLSQSKLEKVKVEQLALKSRPASIKIESSTTNFALDSVKISGQVRMEDGRAMPGCYVFVEELKIKTSTNIDGNYQMLLSIPSNSKTEITLVFEMIGYKKLMINVRADQLSSEQPLILNAQFTEEFVSELGFALVVIEDRPFYKRWWFSFLGWFR